MTEDRDEALLRRIRQQLDHSVESLDGETRSRLTSARSHALDAGRSRSRPAWLSAGGLALASALIIAVVVGNLQPPGPEGALLVELLEDGQDLELVSTIENLELLEDLEFYYWLEEGARNAG